MIPKMSCGIKSGPTPNERIVERSLDLKARTSVEDESIENVLDSNGGLEDTEVAICYSCASSFSDDSGFTSDFEDKDCFVEGMLKANCGCDDEDEKRMKGNCDSDDKSESMEMGNCGSDNEGEKRKKGNCDCILDKDEKVEKSDCAFNHESVKVKKDNFDEAQKFSSSDAEISESTCDCQSLMLESVRLAGSENALSDTPTHTVEDLPIKTNAAVELSSHLPSDSDFLNRRQINFDLDEAKNKINICPGNQDISVKRRQRPDSANSFVNNEAPASLRTGRRRRCRVQDLNNNDIGSRNLSSFLRKAPFKLQDCFHDQGLLSLVACIVYTLILVVVISVLNMILESLKSYIGMQKLKKIRRNIVSYRCSRRSMATG